MSALQSSTGLSIDFSNLPAATAEAFRSAAASIHQWVERQDQGSEAFAGFEVELLKHACAICRAAVGDYIEARDVEEGPVHREGQVFYRAAPTQKTIHTLFGPVTFSRSRYRVHSGSSSIAPVDESLGLVDGYLTVPAAYRALLVMDHCTPRDAAKLFEKLGGMNPSSSHLRRLLVTAGNLWKEKGEVAPGHNPEGEAGTDGGGFFRCLARRGDGCASLQRARRSMLARSVLRNGQFP